MGRADILIRGTFVLAGVYLLAAQRMGWPPVHWSLLLVLAALLLGWKTIQVRRVAGHRQTLWREAPPKRRRQMRNLTFIVLAVTAALFTVWNAAQP